MDIAHLIFLETSLSLSLPLITDSESNFGSCNHLKPQKSFVEALSNVCNILTSQLAVPYMKGDQFAISITEDEYLLGLESCKHNLRCQILW